MRAKVSPFRWAGRWTVRGSRRRTPILASKVRWRHPAGIKALEPLCWSSLWPPPLPGQPWAWMPRHFRDAQAGSTREIAGAIDACERDLSGEIEATHVVRSNDRPRIDVETAELVIKAVHETLADR